MTTIETTCMNVCVCLRKRITRSFVLLLRTSKAAECYSRTETSMSRVQNLIGKREFSNVHKTKKGYILLSCQHLC
jgi:hypothetical protein